MQNNVNKNILRIVKVKTQSKIAYSWRLRVGNYLSHSDVLKHRVKYMVALSGQRRIAQIVEHVSTTSSI
jgi:hypothetical protein